MSVSFRVEGFEELDRELKKLSVSQGRNASARALKEAAKPTLEFAKDIVPYDQGDLDDSLKISMRLSSKEKRFNKRERGEVMVFVGSTSPIAPLVEFGTEHSAPHAFMRPAWESTKMKALDILGDKLWESIQRTIRLNAARSRR